MRCVSSLTAKFITAMLRAVGMAHYQLSSLGAAAQQAAFLRSVNYGVYVGTMVFGEDCLLIFRILPIVDTG